MRAVLATAALWPCVAASTAGPSVCSTNGSTPAQIEEVCTRFCSGECAFLNVTAGDTGLPELKTLYRVTPWNVTSIINKDTGDPAGDIFFYLQNKNQNTAHESFLRTNDIFAQFSVDVDGEWGPYKQCNPVDKSADPTKPYDNFLCENNCMSPPHCPASTWLNGNSGFGGIHCGCKRGNTTVGRVDMANAFSHSKVSKQKPITPHSPPSPDNRRALQGSDDAYWKCTEAVSKLCPRHHWGPPPPPGPPNACLTCAGAHASELKSAGCTNEFLGHACSADFMTCRSAVEKVCGHSSGQACDTCALTNTEALMDANCTASYLEYACGGGGHHHGGGGIFVDIGGYWFSTQVDGMCTGSATPGDSSSCSWKVDKVLKFTNESCVNARFDAAVVATGKACFANCTQPLNTSDTCYTTCYAKTLEGDHSTSPPTTGMTKDQILKPWVTAFTEDDPAKGGCPRCTGPIEHPCGVHLEGSTMVEEQEQGQGGAALLPAHAVRDACAQYTAALQTLCEKGMAPGTCADARAARDAACA